MSHPVLAVLAAQQEAWNRGSLDGYLAACAADVVYLNAHGLAVGRDALAAALRSAYPDPVTMGALDLDVLQVDGRGEPDQDGAEATVTLRWRVTSVGSAVGGHALVVFRRCEGHWEMTHDATVRGG